MHDGDSTDGVGSNDRVSDVQSRGVYTPPFGTLCKPLQSTFNVYPSPLLNDDWSPYYVKLSQVLNCPQ